MVCGHEGSEQLNWIGGKVCLPHSFCPDHSTAWLLKTWSRQLDRTVMYYMPAVTLHVYIVISINVLTTL